MLISNENFSTLPFKKVLGLVLHYFIGFIFVYQVIAIKITLWMDPAATTMHPLTLWGVYAITFFVTIGLAWSSLKQACIECKGQKRKFILSILYYTMMLFIISIVFSIVVNTFAHTIQSTNQAGIETASDIQPLITIVSTCIFAPIVEECVFRAGVFSWIRSKGSFIVAALTSSLLFGSIHIIDSILIGNFADMSYILVYSAMGLLLAYSYEKSKSLLVPIGVHALNNMIIVLFLVL